MILRIAYRLGQLLNPIWKPITLIYRRLSGQDHRAHRLLGHQLASFRAKYDTLQKKWDTLQKERDALQQARDTLQQERNELSELFEDSEKENKQFRVKIKQLEDQTEFLQLLVSELEDERDGLHVQLDSLLSAQPNPIVADEPRNDPVRIDLSGLNLALVGGHDSTRRGVLKELSSRHGLKPKNCVELPPSEHSSLGKGRIKSKIQHCDLIVNIVSYTNHKLTDSLHQLKVAGALSGEILPVNCRGVSGVIREILNHLG